MKNIIFRKGQLPGSSLDFLRQFGRQQQQPLIGRDDEYEALYQMLLEAERYLQPQARENTQSMPLSWSSPPRVSCAVVHGEPGIGKTRLAEEVGRTARQRGWSVILSRAYHQERSNPYYLWCQIIHVALEQKLWQPSGEQLQTLYQPLLALLPQLGDFQAVEPASSALPQGQERLRLWDAIFTALTAIAEQTPLLLILDDLHLADDRSCELFAYLVRRLVDWPLLLVGTYRENDLSPSHLLASCIASMQREKIIAALRLSALSNEDIARLVSHLPADSMIRQVQSLAAGNPFFAEELAHVFLCTGAPATSTVDEEHTWTLPETIVAVMDQRLGHLSPQCQQFLGRAAVLGGSFTFFMLQAMEYGVEPIGDEEELFCLIEEALGTRVITEEGRGANITYHFWHPLLVSHLYDALSLSSRSQLHQRAARVLCQVYAACEEEGAASITHHLLRGAAPDEQIAYYAELAGNRAYQLFAYPDAERYYRLVLKYQPETSVNALSARQRSTLLMRLGESRKYQGKFEEAYCAYEQALQLCCQYQALPASLEEIQVQALLWCEMGATWYSRGRFDQARQCYRRSEQLLIEHGVIAGPAWAYLLFQRGHVTWREGSYKEARRVAYEALRLFEAMSAQSPALSNAGFTRIECLLRGDPVNLGRSHALLGLIAISDSRCSSALSHLNNALVLYEQLGLHRDLAVVCCNLGEAHMRKAEYPQAREFFLRSLTIAERIGEIPLTFYLFCNLGLLDLHCGNLSDAELKFRRSLVLVERFDDPVSWIVVYVYLAMAFQDQGKLSEATKALHQALLYGRMMYLSPNRGLALVMVGRMRILQAIHATTPPERVRLLKRACSTLRHAVAIHGLEAEARVEGYLLLAQAHLLLDQREVAYPLVLQVLGEAHQFELSGLCTRALCLLGDLLVAQGQTAQALPYFQQAMREFQASGMRLHYARALLCYGSVLLQEASSTEPERQQGLQALRDAHNLFVACQSMHDSHLARTLLAAYHAAPSSEASVCTGGIDMLL